MSIIFLHSAHSSVFLNTLTQNVLIEDQFWGGGACRSLLITWLCSTSYPLILKIFRSCDSLDSEITDALTNFELAVELCTWGLSCRKFSASQRTQYYSHMSISINRHSLFCHCCEGNLSAASIHVHLSLYVTPLFQSSKFSLFMLPSISDFQVTSSLMDPHICLITPLSDMYNILFILKVHDFSSCKKPI